MDGDGLRESQQELFCNFWSVILGAIEDQYPLELWGGGEGLSSRERAKMNPFPALFLGANVLSRRGSFGLRETWERAGKEVGRSVCCVARGTHVDGWRDVWGAAEALADDQVNRQPVILEGTEALMG